TARSVINQIEFGVVGEVAPDAGHPAFLERCAAPGFIARLTRARNQFIAPQLLAVARIVSGHVAAEAGVLAGAAGDHHAIGDNRAGRILHIEIAAAFALPDALAGLRVERDNDVVPSGENDAVAIQGNAALGLP